MVNSKSALNNTGYKGIYFDKAVGKFRSRIIPRDNVWITIGFYETLKEAVKAREDFIKSLF